MYHLHLYTALTGGWLRVGTFGDYRAALAAYRNAIQVIGDAHCVRLYHDRALLTL